MRVFITVLVLIFSLQSWTKADDISDFEIEGMSVGDSLLDYFSEEEIKNNIDKESYHYIKKNPGKFMSVTFNSLPSFKTYEAMQFTIKKNDKKYKAYTVKGIISYIDNINDCYKEMYEIDDELSLLFKNLDREQLREKHGADKSGKSQIEYINYWFPNKDLIEIECYDWSKEIEYTDHLRIGAKLNEFNEWLLEK